MLDLHTASPKLIWNTLERFTKYKLDQLAIISAHKSFQINLGHTVDSSGLSFIFCTIRMLFFLFDQNLNVTPFSEKTLQQYLGLCMNVLIEEHKEQVKLQ